MIQPHPKLSIVMPTYNHEQFIREAIDSLLGQTFQDFELIVVNDESSDGTASIVRSYTDPRIRYFEKENPNHWGPGSALNYGFAQSRGDYETWFASDNVAYPLAYKTLCDHLDGDIWTDYVYGNCDIGEWTPEKWNLHNIKREINQEWKRGKLLQGYFLGVFWVWRRWVRLHAGQFMEQVCEDYDMALRMEETGAQFKFLDVCLGKHRRHDGTLSRKTPHAVHEPIKAAARHRRASL